MIRNKLSENIHKTYHTYFLKKTFVNGIGQCFLNCGMQTPGVRNASLTCLWTIHVQCQKSSIYLEYERNLKNKIKIKTLESHIQYSKEYQ